MSDDSAKAQHLLHRRSRDRHPPGRDDLPRRAPPRHQAAASVLLAQARLPAGRQLPRLHGRDRRRARAGGKLHPHADARHEGEDPDRPRQDRAPHGRRAADDRPAGSGARARSGFRALEDRQAPEDRGRPLPQARADQGAAARPQPRRDGGQSRRLHPVQSLRPRLPRGAGQRRHRHGRPRPSREDRVRLRRSDGRLDLRRLRRMRAGLPDRRADAGDAGRREQRLHRQARPRGATACAPIAASAASSPTRSRTTSSSPSTGTQRPGQPEPAVREGPLRLRLRRQSAAPDEADDPQGRRAEGAARVHRSVESVDAFPRGDLGGGARPRRRRPQENPRPRRLRRRSPASARPRARTKRPICSRSSCAPASAPTMSITARGSATPRRWRRCSKASARRR